MTHLCQNWGELWQKDLKGKKNIFLTFIFLNAIKQFFILNHKVPLGQLGKYSMCTFMFYWEWY